MRDAEEAEPTLDALAEKAHSEPRQRPHADRFGQQAVFGERPERGPGEGAECASQDRAEEALLVPAGLVLPDVGRLLGHRSECVVVGDCPLRSRL